MKIVGLKAALNSTGRYAYKSPEATVDHVIVGGGVIGLAIARQLSLRYPAKSTYIIERNSRCGEETSSRNSEVIHAGLYYPPDSLKASLCIRGRELLYRYCTKRSVPFRKCGKLVVALKHQHGYIQSLYKKASSMQWPSIPDPSELPEHVAVPTRLIAGDEARDLEPDLSKDIVSALYSTETGIIDSHTFMDKLEEDIISSDGGSIVHSTRVVRVDPHASSQQTNEDGWVVQMVTGDSSTSDTLLAKILINASGLSANLIFNSFYQPEDRIPMYYARGSYAAYNGRGVSNVSRLIYPCPDTDKSGHAFQSLGTHLTMDMDGNIKFGPDIQWISPVGHKSSPKPSPDPAHQTNSQQNTEEFSYDEADIDFWKHHLVPDESQLELMHQAVRTFLSGVEASKFRPDYVGIRPKLVPPWGGFQDFVFRVDHPQAFSRNQSSDNMNPMISLMGMESPGLTASLAIAEKVNAMIESYKISS